ncbi:glycine betaine ABC transporter substrate-binding protein [Sporosarcina sp. 6E9]|uniref:glycine betaine ABC transporter substrate-binding protein n=1 Tax=Sporosarcina sp. 6E9 TaxID=2819235 RepID=UPI001B304914|nr:glycine betaine ABC transporter substrate-binding protein [Sporosarcina sp. 6E9]
MFKKLTGIGTAALLTLGLAACSGDSTNANAEKEEESIGESVDYTITGIDPGSGHMQATERVLAEYELSDWELTSANGAAMTAALKRAYDKEEPIIVTGWNPHWKFITFDLKFLDDPELVYGDVEQIHTYARLGLKEDLPEAYTILERFQWTPEDMGEIMIEIEDGIAPEDASRNWIDKNDDKIAEWTEGVESVDGDEITLVYSPWDSEIASHNMMKLVLEDMGHKVTLSSVEPGPLFSSLASGGADVSLAAWLPYTHKDYVEKYEGKFDDLGANMEGVRQGLVVPTYMEDVNSIEDLKN